MGAFSRAVVITLLCAGLGGAGRAVAQEAESPKAKSKFEQAIEGKKKADGLWTVYSNDRQLLVELKDSDIKKDYIVLTSIARGISSGMVIGGMSWGLGDDVLWTFRKSDDRIYVIRRNVRYRAKPSSPEASAVDLAYTDSVLYALPIITKTPSGASLVDMTEIFMSDDAQIGTAIGPGFRFAGDRSTWAKIKPFPNNLELEVAAVYQGSGPLGPKTVPDPRGVQINVHYSVSALAAVGANGYKPRVADDRIGYFLTVLKDFSDKEDDEHFVRHINRWNLQKKDPSLPLSQPKEPIVFYLEKTVPVFLRPTIEAGILEWNKAFEKLGFAGAIRVQNEEDIEGKLEVDIDPEDIRYNFFRWITADAGFAMGPSRVDPRTGEILDADIIFDAGFLDYWKQDYETFTHEDAQRLLPNYNPLVELDGSTSVSPHAHSHAQHCSYCQQMSRQMGFAAAVFAGRDMAEKDGKLPEEFIHQGLKEVVMHEVGHTLGLRHNFKASSWKTLEEMNDLEKGKESGTVASVMDYASANIARKGEKQGLYYSQTLGPYDHWAIEYGYKPISGDEKEELKKVAARSGEPGLAYATDEDTRGIDPDPLTNRFDLGKDPLVFVERQMKHAEELLPTVVEKSVKDGDGYQRARQSFGLLFGEYWRSLLFASRFPGGLYMHRHHKGDADGKPPFEVVEADKQRKAMKLIVDAAFASPEYDGKTLNYLAASRWDHWGMRDTMRLDYPIHDTVLQMQGLLLRQVLSSLTLNRLQDSEYKVAADEDAYTLAEHLQLTVDGVFGDWKADGKEGEFTNRKPYISSFSRNLQREALKQLGNMVSRDSGVPEDARTLTRMHLQRLDGQAETLLKSEKLKLDDYTRAHVADSQARIQRILNAELSLPSVN